MVGRGRCPLLLSAGAPQGLPPGLTLELLGRPAAASVACPLSRLSRVPVWWGAPRLVQPSRLSRAHPDPRERARPRSGRGATPKAPVGAAGHRLQGKPLRHRLAGSPPSRVLLSSPGLCRPTFHEALPVGEAWGRGPLPSRACDIAPGRAGTPCSPRTPADAEMEVSSGQAGQHHHGTLVTHQVGEPQPGRWGPQHLQDPRPRLGLGTSPSRAQQGSQAGQLASLPAGDRALASLGRPGARWEPATATRCQELGTHGSSQVLRGELGVLPLRAREGLQCVHQSCEGSTPQVGHLAFLAGRGIS